MTMNFQRAARTLGDELRAKGYAWRLEHDGKHPRLVISCKNQERFVLMSASANYDEGALLDMKRQDIARDVLPHLPEPEPSLYVKDEPRLSALETPPEAVTGVEAVSHPVKVYIGGRGGSLCVSVPRAVVPPGKRAQLFKTVGDGGCLGLIIGDAGVEPSNSKAPDRVTFYFPRADVPFKFAKEHPKEKLPPMLARMRGTSLVLTKPLPQCLLEDIPETKPLSPEGKAVVAAVDNFNLEHGEKLIARLNAWLAWAAANGYNPTPSINNNRIEVEITEVRHRRLS